LFRRRGSGTAKRIGCRGGRTSWYGRRACFEPRGNFTRWQRSGATHFGFVFTSQFITPLLGRLLILEERDPRLGAILF
jgi:hypothetical protein